MLDHLYAVANSVFRSRESVPEYDYSDQARKFKFGTFWTNVEVFKTWSKVRIDCEKTASTPVFNTNITKTLKLDEFEQLQTAAINAAKLHLRETLVEAHFLSLFSYCLYIIAGFPT
jgi:hypothetical protein